MLNRKTRIEKVGGKSDPRPTSKFLTSAIEAAHNSPFCARFMALGERLGQKHGFRPRCTHGCTGSRAPEWPLKRETSVLTSQALATDPFPRFFQARPARKLRLTDPKCLSAATQISSTRLKTPKMAVFVTISPQRVFLRIFDCQPAGLLW